MKKKIVLKKLQLNKERIVALTQSQAELVLGGGTTQNPKPNPNPRPIPQPTGPVQIPDMSNNKNVCGGTPR